jgi:hypothetical protein
VQLERDGKGKSGNEETGGALKRKVEYKGKIQRMQTIQNELPGQSLTS